MDFNIKCTAEKKVRKDEWKEGIVCGVSRTRLNTKKDINDFWIRNKQIFCLNMNFCAVYEVVYWWCFRFNIFFVYNSSWCVGVSAFSASLRGSLNHEMWYTEGVEVTWLKD